MKKTEEQMLDEARELIQNLNFDECLELFEKLPSGSPMERVVLGRMIYLDEERFIKLSFEY